ncbi:Arylsulfatase I [Mizuhopecten yessoensis]|uniref:Arylsulfatase I n=1 Tax=Mizuhopecten yessoensis TaxID=6573 RepID=A0A210Q2C1_MIZYE|nr:Arylsulfatase I [Mizuhopecten yessoensis]
MNPALQGQAAIGVGDYKPIEGCPGLYPGWYKPETETINLQTKKNDINTTDDERYKETLNDDPYEHHDLSLSHSNIAEELSKKIAEYHKQMIPANFAKNSAAFNPEHFKGYWSPGCC